MRHSASMSFNVALVSVAIVVTMQNIVVFHKEWFQLLAPSQWVIEVIR